MFYQTLTDNLLASSYFSHGLPTCQFGRNRLSLVSSYFLSLLGLAPGGVAGVA
jgi:hypothetical protein